jgi:hypothetical protein
VVLHDTKEGAWRPVARFMLIELADS